MNSSVSKNEPPAPDDDYRCLKYVTRAAPDIQSSATPPPPSARPTRAPRLTPATADVTTALRIRSFRHKGLARYFHTGDARGLSPKLVARIRDRLLALEAAGELRQLDAPGLRLHALKGDRAGRFAIDVNGPWRITFEWRDGHVHRVDLEQYH